MSATEYADKIFYDIMQLKSNSGEEKYKLVYAKYRDFTMTFPLVVKYMCFYQLYNSKLFDDYIMLREKARPTYEEGFKLQADYIKKLLVKSGIKRGEALKCSNMELESIMKDVKQIKRREREIKKKIETDKKQYMLELRKEFKTAVNEMIDSI